ncbi:MAG: hypothetical protein KAU21_08305 [Gammaproteobacteria bacterium]|nr:hypothetical protein [Gammaproteobacteria bacterium]
MSIYAIEKTTPDNLTGGTSSLSDWHHDYINRCYFVGKKNLQNEATGSIKNILAELDKAPFFARYLLNKAKYRNTAFCIEDRADGARGYFDYRYNIIAVRKKLDLFTRVMIFIHELRHVDHVSRGFCQSIAYDDNEMVRLNFAIEADANAFSALYAWKLKENGFPQVWNKLFELPNYADIFEAFYDEIQTSDDELKATRGAFVQWYKSEWRRVNYYRNCISGYHDMLDDTKLIQRYNKLPEGYFDNLCSLPDGSNYGCHLTAEINNLKKQASDN